jgi:hypothetical protein
MEQRGIVRGFPVKYIDIPWELDLEENIIHILWKSVPLPFSRYSVLVGIAGVKHISILSLLSLSSTSRPLSTPHTHHGCFCTPEEPCASAFVSEEAL